MERQDGKVLLAGLIGLGVGLGVGALLSPRSGKDVRKEIKDKADEARSTADTIANRAKKKWRELREEARRDLEAARKDRRMADERIDNLDIEI